MKCFFILAITWVTAIAGAEEFNLDQYLQSEKEFMLNLAQKYKDLALVSADARENKQLFCTHETFVADIVEKGIKAISYSYEADIHESAQIIKDLRADMAFNSAVKGNYSFRKTELYPQGWSETVSEVDIAQQSLIGSKFWGIGLGAYGSQTSVEFITDKKAVLGVLEVLNEEPWARWTYKTVSYSVANHSNKSSSDVKITIDQVPFILRQNWGDVYSNGSYELIPMNVPENTSDFDLKKYVEYASECEA